MGRKIILLVLLTVLAGSMVGILLRKRNVSDARVPVTRAAVAAPSTVAARRPANRQPPATLPVDITSEALPPAGTPLRDIYPALTARWEAGDVRAGCRLSFELNRCRLLPDLRESVEQQIARAANAAPGAEKNFETIARLQRYEAQHASLCDGFDVHQAPPAWQILRRAADAGHLPSMLRFAIQPPMSERAFVQDLEGWKAYDQSAARLLQAAVRRGSPEAAYYLHLAYSDFPMPGGARIVAPDPMEALTYAHVAQASSDEASTRKLQARIDKLERSLDASASSAAKARADRLLRQHPPTTTRRVDFSANLVPDDVAVCES